MGILDFFGSSSNAEASSSTSSSPSTSTPASPPHQAEKAVNPLNPNGLKPCCACPETKSVRDDCFLRSTPEEAEVKCKDLIEAHKACMRGYGFKV